MNKTDAYLYQEIAESLRRRIASGELQPNDKLPSVRQMATQWGCTPGTVNRAYAKLMQEGLVAGFRGGGTRVAAGMLHHSPQQSSAWQWASLVNQAERFLLEAIGSGNTPAQAEAALSMAISRVQALQENVGPPPDKLIDQPSPIRFMGSHDLSVEYAFRLLQEEFSATSVEVEYVGSLGGLMALAQNKAEIAGSHLWDEGTDTYNLPFIERLLPGRKIAVVTLAHRSLGLIVPPGNPQNLRSISDLAGPEVIFINRQAGSGTRVWLDAQLKALDIPASGIPNYNREVLTHLAVADAISQGQSTAGIGISAAASAYGLAFIPLTQERYDLVFTEAAWSAPLTQSLLNIIRSPRFAGAVEAFGGYDTSQTGQTTWVA